MSNRIPWPTLHTGLEPKDIPIGYHAFDTIWDDDRGYEPRVVGYETDADGRQVILLAISPGAVISATMVSAGQPRERAGQRLVEAVQAIQATGFRPPPETPAESPGDPVKGLGHRED